MDSLTLGTDHEGRHLERQRVVDRGPLGDTSLFQRLRDPLGIRDCDDLLASPGPDAGLPEGWVLHRCRGATRSLNVLERQDLHPSLPQLHPSFTLASPQLHPGFTPPSP